MLFLELAKKRYSARSYDTRPVEKENLDLILQAGSVAPTAANRQPQRLIVANDAESMAKVRKATDSHHGAPLAILVLGDHNEEWVRPFDGKGMAEIDSAVTTHMMLAAESLGLGSCWVTYFKPDVIREAFALPAHLEPMHILLLGYAKGDAPSSERHGETRKPLEETVSFHTL